MPRGDVANSGPELGDTIARKPVVDAVAVPPRTREAGLREQPQMMRRGRGALAHLARDLVDRAFALCEYVDDLGPPPAPERGRDRRERIEQGALCRLLTHTFKLMFE